MPYIYRLMDEKNEILYIGYSTSLTNRIKRHLTGNGIAKEAIDRIKKVEYMNAPLKKGKNLEQYLINRYKPVYNLTSFPPDMDGVPTEENWQFFCNVVNRQSVDKVDIGYEPKPCVKQVSFKYEELYLLDLLKEKYRLLNFSNYVKQLIHQDLYGNSAPQAPIPQQQPAAAEPKKANGYNVEEEREELDL